MKSSFPKIYSLSTLGIIHHFNCDYLFHKIRTDFTGESGSGKSMVADMLQAIFVGSGAYESSTKGNDDRPLEGMALKPKGKQFGMGYIFLNIQIAPKQHIVVGIYIESSSRNTQSFIIQSGYNWDGDFGAIPNPVFYKDLLVDGKIAPIEVLPDELIKRNLNIKSLPVKKYHQLLFFNNILPIDLSQSKVALDSYANILRSFSRGKGFKKDSDNLKDFLFGNEDENALMQQYSSEVKSISDDYRDHNKYRDEIELISKKQNLIKDILDRKNEFDKKHKEYLTAKVLYCVNQQELVLKKFNETKANYAEASLKQSLLEKREIELLIKEINRQKTFLNQYRKDLQTATNKIQSLKHEKDKYTKSYEENLKKKSIVDIVEQWLKKINGSNITVEKAYQEDKLKKEKKTQLETFVQYLDQNKITNSFESSEWLTDFQKASQDYDKHFALITQKIISLETLQVFSDLNNTDSLAAWAIIFFKRALSIEEESTLMHFQSLSRTKPVKMDGERYLPFPESLFDNLDIKDSETNGFWLNLNGVYEFITLVPKQYFKRNNFDELRQVMSALQQKAAEELKELSQKKNEITHLKELLFKFIGLEQVIRFYSDKEAILNFEPEPTFNISENDLNNYLKIYKNKVEILNEYKKAVSAYEASVSDESKNNQNISSLNNRIIEVETFFHKRQITEDQIPEYVRLENEKTNDIDTKIGKVRSEFSISGNQIESISNKLFQSIDGNDLSEVIKYKFEYSASFKTISKIFEEDQAQFNMVDENLAQALDKYQTTFLISFVRDESKKINILNPDEGQNSLKDQYNKAQADFRAKYEVALDELDEKEQLKDSYNLGQLAHKLLPTVFESSRIDENLIDQKISDRLESVNRTIKEIGSRKVEILKKVFAEVYRTYNKYLTKINQIDNYFKAEGKVITGGNRASLKYKKSNDYPDKWMAPFRKQLDEQLTHTGLFEQLLQEVDINTMMIKAFVAAGGSEKVTPADLLNPKSYFNLTFDLKLESGDNNAGSNGQTYTATALLGIARLSLIEMDEGGKKRVGLRFMPIDEAEGLGGNYTTLCKIAEEEGYQIISMSIEPAGELKHGEQYVYIMNENPASSEDNYVPPFGIFSEGEITENIGDFVYKEDE